MNDPAAVHVLSAFSAFSAVNYYAVNNNEFLPSTIPIGAKPPSSAGDQKGAGYLSDRLFSNYCAKEMPVNIGQTMERGDVS